MEALSGMNFCFSTSFIVLSFSMLCLHSLNSRKSLISFFMSPLTKLSLCSFQQYVGFYCFVVFVSLALVCSVLVESMELFQSAFIFEACFVFYCMFNCGEYSMSCWEASIFSVGRTNILEISVKSIWFVTSVSFTMPLFGFCFDVLYIS